MGSFIFEEISSRLSDEVGQVPDISDQLEQDASRVNQKIENENAVTVTNISFITLTNGQIGAAGVRFWIFVSIFTKRLLYGRVFVVRY